MGLLTDEELALDPYKVLNLEITSTEKEIKKSYRLLALKWHPDKNKTSEAVIKFREIELSRGILEDVAKRRFVDEKLEGERRRKVKMAAFDKKRKVLVDVSSFFRSTFFDVLLERLGIYRWARRECQGTQWKQWIKVWGKGRA